MSDAFAGMKGVFNTVVVLAIIGGISCIIGLFLLVGFVGNWLLKFI